MVVTGYLLELITIQGSPWLQAKLKALCMEFIDVFATKVRRESTIVEPMEIKVDQSIWQLPCYRAPDIPKKNRWRLESKSMLY